MHIFLFAGTSEGRRIAEAIVRRTLRCRCGEQGEAAVQRNALSADVYVATDYGAQLLPEGPGVTVHTGRLRQEEMQEEFADAVRRSAAGPSQGPVLVIDATHPYAVVVSGNIRRACAALRLPCIRVQRLSAHPEAADGMHRVSSIEDAAEWLRTWGMDQSADDSAPDDRPNILITTGSKELQPYTKIPDFAARCYVRALPTEAALSVCQRLGFRQDHLILMQGPFSEDMNRAQLRYARAGVLVTKDSGETGGFPEKCEAAAAEHTALLVIGRPKEVSIPDASWYHIADLNEVLRLFQADRE